MDTATLPARGPKVEAAEGQLLTFIVLDRKPFHHPTFAAAAQERDFLAAKSAAEPPRYKGGKRVADRYRVMKVLNLSGAQLEDKVVIADRDKLDIDGLHAAHAALRHYTADEEGEYFALERIIRAYLDALK